MAKEDNGWPRKGDRVFKSDGNPRTNAHFPWLQILGLDCVIADAFKGAADLVVDGLAREKQPHHVDRYLMPVGYLYRHYLELKLKYIIDGGVAIKAIMVKDDELGTHNLNDLWKKFTELVTATGMGNDPAPMAATAQVVKDFHDHDKSGSAFRYARHKDTKKPLLKNPPDWIGLTQMRDVMARVHTFLDGCEDWVNAAFDATNSGG